MRLVLAALLACLAVAARADGARLELDAKITWREPWTGFGGFSGLVVSADGRGFTTISDRGGWAAGVFTRRGGRLSSADATSRGWLHAISGARLGGVEIDAEGLAIGPDRRAWVSFEGYHRVRTFDALGGKASGVRNHPDFRRLQANSGLEALAIDADGVVYAIPERSGALDRPFPVYRFRDGRWDKRLRIRRDGSFLPVDADFGPDGKLYLLERDFTWVGGFATRVRRFTLDAQGFGDEVTLLRTPFGELDNMEGLSAWRDAAGRIRVVLISDDNFFPLQRTMFVEYVLVEP